VILEGLTVLSDFSFESIDLFCDVCFTYETNEE
jgi:hypothetical protein